MAIGRHTTTASAYTNWSSAIARRRSDVHITRHPLNDRLSSMTARQGRCGEAMPATRTPRLDEKCRWPPRSVANVWRHPTRAACVISAGCRLTRAPARFPRWHLLPEIKYRRCHVGLLHPEHRHDRLITRARCPSSSHGCTGNANPSRPQPATGNALPDARARREPRGWLVVHARPIPCALSTSASSSAEACTPRIR
jgi:hypothetical protein